MDDGVLWERVVEGNKEAFDQLYCQYSPPVRSFVRHYVGDPSAVDDLVQETFLQLWKKPNGFHSERGTLKQYIFGIARKRAAQWIRETPVHVPADSSEPTTNSSAEMTLLKGALEQLAKDERALLWLREIEGYSYTELASILEIPVGTVKSRLFSARETLRRVWRMGMEL